MEKSCKDYAPHPHLLETLFAFKKKVSAIFRDVLGIYEIHHISITQVTSQKKFISLSSTPALEFNLFNSALWRYDRSYDPQWFTLNRHDYWSNLYEPARYDELYYLKQIKHDYASGISLATRLNEQTLIYSLASQKSCPNTLDAFINLHEDFYKIGHYCFNLLEPLFHQCEIWKEK
ncbi:hypothetical protein [Legionella sp. km772]|uniref:hypothetical protein n=1 Tax=Legionella sp. km772 TaxID=2498111 RepID=UPI000F8E9296|nr:hypothetical protein [Legionella sp. km772]RUR12013.1 hypothetical protein ELY15_06355 [Legionella sp. km772]